MIKVGSGGLFSVSRNQSSILFGRIRMHTWFTRLNKWAFPGAGDSKIRSDSAMAGRVR
jgi:hypothetical protein